VRASDHPEPATGAAGIARLTRRRLRSEHELAFSPFRDGIAALIATWSEAALDVAALLFFPLLVLLPRGIAAFASAAGLCAAALVLSAGPIRVRRKLVSAAMLLTALVLWGAVSALWAVDPARSLEMAVRLAGLFAAGLALAAAADCIAAPRRLILLLLAGLVLGFALTIIELATAGSLSSLLSTRIYRETRLNQASVLIAVLMFPAGAMLVAAGRRILAIALMAAAAATVCTLAGTAAKVALCAGVPTALLLYHWRPQAARAAAIISVVMVVTAPLTFARLERVPGLGETADSIKISAGHRLLIWSFAGDRIAERALTGWGLDASRAIPGGKDPIRPGEPWMPLHPHNAALQLWLELGPLGAVLFALLAAGLWDALALARWPPVYSAGAGAALTAALVSCSASYGIWEEWWLGSLWFCVFVILVMARIADRLARSMAAAVAAGG
jgi:exopolysaccharide production protein ExoQ